MAALLGVSLGGINRYQGKISNRPKLGDGVYSLEAKHIPEAIDIMKKTDRFFLLFFMIGGVCFDAAITWSQSILSL
jgi:adenosylcobinamide-phosphate synthase